MLQGFDWLAILWQGFWSLLGIKRADGEESMAAGQKAVAAVLFLIVVVVLVGAVIIAIAKG